MAEAASSGTATALTPAPSSRADVIDAATIRQTFSTVLRATHPVPVEEQALVGTMLLGHVQLLVPELTAALPRLRGEWRCAGEHVLASTRRMLKAGLGTSQDDLDMMATQCRALLSLRQHAAPLTCLTARTTEGRS
ncbi:DUF6415 family natural product biosynthesis protein [Streptomyces acidiscabies]|uniref:Uncharacterized protein n=1 Tax=Streptomyces acidiscabies TaxID=42234 RepID=A0ABU4MBZ3_9ACTN|nr:DUF6415 family natural product biosynthesis protein [Streptomyces acidiscabies]MDX3025371.1 hypothetical protein [Streptomyces acidiscabies]